MIGITDPDYDHKCGPMGVGELLLDPENKKITDFIRLLAQTRRQVVDYLVDGYMGSPPVLDPSPPVYSQSKDSVNENLGQLDYDSVSRASWRLESDVGSTFVAIIITNNMDEAFGNYSGRVRVESSEDGKIGIISCRLFQMNMHEGIKKSRMFVSEIIPITFPSSAGDNIFVMPGKDMEDDSFEWVQVDIPPRSVLVLEQML